MSRTTIATLALLLLAGSTRAADDAKAPAKDPPDDARKLGSDDAACHTFYRAGFPQCISKYARPTDTCHFCGYYVGGGSVRCGGSPVPPSPELGTWGRDYCGGCLTHPFVMLGWGDRYQGGIGTYDAGGPPVRDPVAGVIVLPETIHHNRVERRCGEQEKE